MIRIAMYTDQMIQDALMIFMNNPFWNKVYNGAPSEGCKERLRLMFCRSTFSPPNAEEFYTYRGELDETLSIEDWKYLQKYGGHNPFWLTCQRHIDNLQGR